MLARYRFNLLSRKKCLTSCCLTSLSHVAHPNITINSLIEWEDGEEYTKVDCSVDSVAPAATIVWHVGNSDKSISSLTETEVQADGLVTIHSSVHFLSSLHSGQNLTCSVEHPSLKAPEKRTIPILVHSMLFLSLKYFFLCHTHRLTQLLIPLLSPLVFFFRSPSAECVCGETAGLALLAGSV